MSDQTVMNGRTDQGRFAPGNRAAAGRSSRAAELRRAFSEAITPEDIRELAAAMMTAAKGGDIAAAKIILDRCCGRPSPDADETAEQHQNANRVLAMLGTSQRREKR